jgi:hypothetical protein
MRASNLMLAFIMALALSLTLTFYVNTGFAGGDDNVVIGNVTNSKYLAITFHKYVNQKDADVITGTIVNNSTKDISSVRIYAALYDDNNKLVTTEAGVVNVPTLTPTLTSPFTISLLNIQKPDHYTLFPGGTPS